MGKAYGNKTAVEKRPAACQGDNYCTPYSLTELLFKYEKFDFEKQALEPAAGCGHMTKVLKDKFNYLLSYDPIYGYEEYSNKELCNSSKNAFVYSFLNSFFKYKIYYIITNPPYSLADEFVIRAKWHNPEKICFLLRLNFLSGAKRLESGIFDGLSDVYVFDRMPDLRAPIRADGKFPTAMNVYAWFVWTRGYTGAWRGHQISCNDFVITEKEINADSEYKKQLIELGIRKK